LIIRQQKKYFRTLTEDRSRGTRKVLRPPSISMPVNPGWPVWRRFYQSNSLNKVQNWGHPSSWRTEFLVIFPSNWEEIDGCLLNALSHLC